LLLVICCSPAGAACMVSTEQVCFAITHTWKLRSPLFLLLPGPVPATMLSNTFKNEGNLPSRKAQHACYSSVQRTALKINRTRLVLLTCRIGSWNPIFAAINTILLVMALFGLYPESPSPKFIFLLFKAKRGHQAGISFVAGRVVAG
jgi:hypothetical protein